MLPPEAEGVLEFWFGSSTDEAAVLAEKDPLWWRKSDDLDREIRTRFGDLREQAKRGELAGWTATVRGRLALIILLDQFSRNLYRGDPEAFATDGAALALAQDGIDRREDQQLRAVERNFMYMPLMHSEDVAAQRRSVELFERLAANAPPALKSRAESYVGYAKAHRDIIERFGRFPHRNVVLGRTSTAEEVEFLKQPGSSF